jgi:hypothetical protein
MGIQEWINHHYKDDRVLLIEKDQIDSIVTKDGYTYRVPDYPHCITYIRWRYKYDDIRYNDRVIDLGANVGGFAIPSSRLTRLPIIALEPLLYEELVCNLRLNSVNVYPVEGCISKKDTDTISWRGFTKDVRGYTLTQIMDKSGGCDFLKMEIEGGEWSIDPEELDGIRRIEGQLHDVHKHRGHPLIKYLEDNYRVEYTSNAPPPDIPLLPVYWPNKNYPMIHCYRRDS